MIRSSRASLFDIGVNGQRVEDITHKLQGTKKQKNLPEASGFPNAPRKMNMCILRPYEGLAKSPIILKPSVKGFIRLNLFKALALQPTLPLKGL